MDGRRRRGRREGEGRRVYENGLKRGGVFSSHALLLLLLLALLWGCACGAAIVIIQCNKE